MGTGIKPMRILTVTHFFEGHGGGIERVAGHLCRALAGQGHILSWAAAGEPCAVETAEPVALAAWNGIERATGLPMPLPSPSSFRRLWRAVRDADAVVIHDSLYVPTIAALLFAKMRRRPVLLIQHVGELPLRSRPLRSVAKLADRLVARRMLAAADQVIFISDTTCRHFSGVRFAAPPELLFNGVDTDIFYASDAVLDPAEPSRRRQVMFAGRFVEKKGLATIEALARLRPDLDFLLAGRGPIDPDRWDLPNVTVRRDVSGAGLADLYRASDLLLLPSVGEGYPLVVQEAMACGLPVICGAESARADPDGSNFLTPIDIDIDRPQANAVAASEAIDDMKAGAVHRAAMAAYARRRYRWDVMAQRVSDLAEGLLALRTSGFQRAHMRSA